MKIFYKNTYKYRLNKSILMHESFINLLFFHIFSLFYLHILRKITPVKVLLFKILVNFRRKRIKKTFLWKRLSRSGLLKRKWIYIKHNIICIWTESVKHYVVFDKMIKKNVRFFYEEIVTLCSIKIDWGSIGNPRTCF